ncbi:hypothetical protein ACFWRZ_07760 [Streptomyces rubiginosohelvolus]|uniref:hypothetical protein n=1 Tax=Streptomyces rubiginosohelvolus TaxID=67362 RepID=UPI0036628AA2
MSARERIAGLLWWSVPSGTTEEAKALTEQMLDAYRAEVTAEFSAWLVKRAREHRVKGPQYAKQADVIGMLASKVQRGAVRPNNLLSLPPQGGPEDAVELRTEVSRLQAELDKVTAPPVADIEYGIRLSPDAPKAEVLHYPAQSRSSVEGRLARHRTGHPEAQLLRRTVHYGEWTEVAS